MDVTPKILADVEFSQALRGFDQDEVKGFLEQMGVAVAQLQGRLKEAVERAERAESQLEEARRSSGSSGSLFSRSIDGPADDEISQATITRTLVMAQRTADQLLAEATEEAEQVRTSTRAEAEALELSSRTESEQLLTSSRSQADQMVAEATIEADGLRSTSTAEAEELVSSARRERDAILAETEEAARQLAEERRAPLLEELRSLEVRRDAMQRDLTLLDETFAIERGRLRSAGEHLVAMADADDFAAAAAVDLEVTDRLEPSYAPDPTDPVATAPSDQSEPDSDPADRPAVEHQVVADTSGDADVVDLRDHVGEATALHDPLDLDGTDNTGGIEPAAAPAETLGLTEPDDEMTAPGSLGEATMAFPAAPFDDLEPVTVDEPVAPLLMDVSDDAPTETVFAAVTPQEMAAEGTTPEEMAPSGGFDADGGGDSLGDGFLDQLRRAVSEPDGDERDQNISDFFDDGDAGPRRPFGRNS